MHLTVAPWPHQFALHSGVPSCGLRGWELGQPPLTHRQQTQLCDICHGAGRCGESCPCSRRRRCSATAPPCMGLPQPLGMRPECLLQVSILAMTSPDVVLMSEPILMKFGKCPALG